MGFHRDTRKTADAGPRGPRPLRWGVTVFILHHFEPLGDTGSRVLSEYDTSPEGSRSAAAAVWAGPAYAPFTSFGNFTRRTDLCADAARVARGEVPAETQNNALNS